MTTETIHTCSYACDRAACIRAQRDELASRLAAAPPPAAARGDVRGLVEVLRNLCSWKHLMSYNEAYFGEPEGELKSVVYAIERHLPSLAADGVQAGEVTQRAEELANMAVTAFISSDLGGWLAAIRAIESALSQQPEARGVGDALQRAAESVHVPPKMTATRGEYFKAGARAMIAAMNRELAAIKGERNG